MLCVFYFTGVFIIFGKTTPTILRLSVYKGKYEKKSPNTFYELNPLSRHAKIRKP